ncbi:MAG TPA: ParB/RepB/Spo0J family partition protein [Chloroflexia bacterium]|nr:ParB/RepB/Spo0J family partition protein [Chloroflexia bacterium]
MPKPRAALGRGIGALIPGAAPPQTPPEEGSDSPDAPTRVRGAALEVPVDSIQPNPQQPRHEFSEEALKELTDSVREHGVIQPLIVTHNETGDGAPYYLIAGERRWRAAQVAGLATVPVIVKDANPEEMLALALVENIQRADLNPLEEAQAYRELMDTFGLTQAEVARRVGRSRSAVANLVRLLNLPHEIIMSLHEGKISEGHARTIMMLEQREDQLAMLDRVISEGYSVRQTEEMVRRVRDGLPLPVEPEPLAEEAEPPEAASDGPARPAPRGPKTRRAPLDVETSVLEDSFRTALKTKVQLSRSRQGGRLVIHFFSEEMLENLYRMLVGEPE